MENTQEQNKTLKPEQMESGKWYVVVDNNNCKWLIKFNFINEYKKVFVDKYCYDLTDGVDRTDSNNTFCFKEDIKSIRPATKEEVLKYFPDEVFEPIELRPEEPADWKAMYYELKAKYDQLEPKGEKVYFYFNEQKDHFCYYKELEGAISLSCNGMKIYEAVCIGKKKSVLVSE